MANPRRDQGHLGVDTNVLVAYLDGRHPSHAETGWLSSESVVLNPTVIHEAYHTLVFRMKWEEEDALTVLEEACADEKNLFVPQSLQTTRLGLRLAVSHHLGGRDALILASFLMARVKRLLTYDRALLALKSLRYGKSTLTLTRP